MPPLTPRHRQAILFLSHHTRPGAMAAFADLNAQAGGAFDVIPVFDQTAGAYAVEAISASALCMTAPNLEAKLPYPHKNAQHPGTLWSRNIDLPLLAFIADHPAYEFVWLIEYDVRFSGDWMTFFSAFMNNDVDLLATTMFDPTFRPGWVHWDSLRSPVDVPMAERVRATLSIYRLSRRAFQAVDAAYRTGWSGHYEVAIPTILKAAGLRIEDVGGDGAFVAPGNRNRFYLNSPSTPGLAPGTFVLHAEGRLQQDIPNMLWNPSKD